MSNRLFLDRITNELDTIGLPQPQSERIDAFAKLVGIHRTQSEAILEGHIPKDELVIKKLEDALEVNFSDLISMPRIK